MDAGRWQTAVATLAVERGFQTPAWVKGVGATQDGNRTKNRRVCVCVCVRACDSRM